MIRAWFAGHTLKIVALAWAASLALVSTQSWKWATARAENRHAAQARALEADFADVSEEVHAFIARINAERVAQAEAIEHIEAEARADPRAVDRIPGTDSLRRLKRRWGADPAAATD